MFTGLVGPQGTVVERLGQGEVTFKIATPWPLESFVLGESIACDGACMTVTDVAGQGAGAQFSFVASAESLAKTTLASWQVGREINLERALKLGDPLGGHLVSGHVDGLVQVVGKAQENKSLRLTFAVPEALATFVAPKGSVALNGVSLTVNGVVGRRFDVNLIPHTAQVTTLGALKGGDEVNFEADPLARYVVRALETRA